MGLASIAGDILGSALRIWHHKLATKYYEEWVKWTKVKYEEEKKPDLKRDMSLIDHADFQLYLLGRSFTSEVSRQNASNKP